AGSARLGWRGRFTFRRAWPSPFRKERPMTKVTLPVFILAAAVYACGSDKSTPDTHGQGGAGGGGGAGGSGGGGEAGWKDRGSGGWAGLGGTGGAGNVDSGPDVTPAEVAGTETGPTDGPWTPAFCLVADAPISQDDFCPAYKKVCGWPASEAKG